VYFLLGKTIKNEIYKKEIEEKFFTEKGAMYCLLGKTVKNEI
jgi:hypothetical protein